MPFFIVKQDITKIKADAIVNPANPTLLGGGGLDGEIHSAAGPRLIKECKALGGCATGEAKITKGYNLPAKYIIHTVGPIWHGGKCGEEELLRRCYRNSLMLAASKKCLTVAIPVISAGAYGYPYDRATDIAKTEIFDFIDKHDNVTVYLVMREKIAPEKNRLYSRIEYYMMQNGISGTDDIPGEIFSECTANATNKEIPSLYTAASPSPIPSPMAARETVKKRSCGRTIKKALLHHAAKEEYCSGESSLENMLENLDKSFSETLLHLIDISGMTDSECYKRANIDRKLFSKIRNDKNYKPSKPTVLAFAIALKLDLDNTVMLLERAGFALSPSSKFDVIIKFFITNGRYDIFEINEALFAFDQNLLGA